MNLGISVILPVYLKSPDTRSFELLERAVRSVVEQKINGPWELIVIDDGSPVPIAEFISSLKIQYGNSLNLRLERLNTNAGIVHALNRGLICAQYPLIARIDADDVWITGKITKQLALFESDPNLTIIGTGMTLKFESGAPAESHIRSGSWPAILEFSRTVGCPFPHGSIVARRDIFHLLGGYSHGANARHCEDFYLWSIWLRFFKPAMIEESLYDYTVSDNSISKNNFSEQEHNAENIRRNLRELHARIPGGLPAIPKLMAELADILKITLIEAGTLAYLVWQHFPHFSPPSEALPVLQHLLPDRMLNQLS